MKIKRECATCRRELPLHMFGRDRSRKDGIAIWCKKCRAARYQKNREAIMERTRRWQAANPNYQKDYAMRRYHEEDGAKKKREYRQKKREEAILANILAEAVASVMEKAERGEIKPRPAGK